jgi:hypothetical protein
MKISSHILRGRLCCVLASLIVIPQAGAQPPKLPVPVAEPVPEVKREERPGLLFGGNRPVPKTEPEIIEVVPESVARERAKQRSKETEGTVEGTIGPDSTLVIVEPQQPPRVESKKEPRRMSNGSQRGTTTGTRTKSSSATREGRTAGETLVLPSTPAPVVTEMPAATGTIHEERSTITQPRGEISTTTQRGSSTSKREIEQLQKKVKDLEKEVAEARREPEKVIAPTPSTAPTPVAGTRPLPIAATAKDERQPLVVDTPPSSAAVSTKTETVRTGTTDAVVTTELPAASKPEIKEAQETLVTTEPPQPPAPQPPGPQPPPPPTTVESTETRTKVDTSVVAETTPRPDGEPVAAPPSPVEPKITTTTPGKIDKLPTKSDVPVAEKTDKSGYVKSPFPPHNLIDVTGMPKGSLAKDPTTMKIFRVP